jgi:LmbE family N-acetylglucosaminyl deacetylase
MSPPELPLRPERVLAIGAHPDDAEFFAGGTLARLRAEGASITCVVCTDGGRGGRGLDDPAGVRRAEQARAAGILGVEVVGLAHPDGELAPGEPLRTELIREIRRARPDLVLAHDPATFFQRAGDRVHLGHSDHRAAGEAALDAVYPRAMSPNFAPELGLEPWAPREVWLFDTARADLVVDIGATLARKLEALAAHASQNPGGALVRAAEAAAKAASAGAFPGEAFVRLRLR